MKPIFTNSFFFILIHALIAQPQLSFEQFNEKAGIRQGHILSIFRDNEGYLWVGTYGGLHRYDGYRFVLFSMADSSGLKHNTFYTIFEDKDKQLWFGTENGLSKFDRKTYQFQTFLHNENDPNSISHNHIRTIVQDKNGFLWIGTYGGGLNRLDPKTNIFINYRKKPNDVNSLVSDIVNSVYFDHSGRLWVGTEVGGLSLFNPVNESFTNYIHDKKNPNSIGDDIISSIYQDKDGIFWIGTWNAGLDRFDEKTGIFTHLKYNPSDPASLPHNTVRTIYQDNESRIWVLTFGGGLALLDPQTQKFYNYKNDPDNPRSLSFNTVWSIFQDSEDILWIGTFGEGLCKFDKYKNKFQVFQSRKSVKNSLISNSVEGLFQDKQGNLWIGTKEGAQIYKPSENKFVSIELNVKSEIIGILRFMQDTDGNVWLAGSGLFRYNPISGKVTRYPSNSTNPNKLNTTGIFDIMQDDEGDIWIGGWLSGLVKLSKTEIEKSNSEVKYLIYKYNEKDTNSISSNVIWNIFEDSRKNMWVGTDKGINLFDKKTGKFTRSNIPNAPNGYHMLEDRSGNLYFGSSSGMYIYNLSSKKSKLLVADSTKTNHTIYSFVSDSNQDIWCGAGSGLYCFNPENQKFAAFNEFDGLPSTSFSFGSASLTDGSLAFGSSKGFILFNPSKITKNSLIPNIVLSDFILKGESVSLENGKKQDIIFKSPLNELKNIELSYYNNSFAIEFAALSLASPEKNSFAYKIEESNDDWIKIGNEHKVSFINLAPGIYNIKIKAANNDNVWNETMKEIQIKILPPWWNTLWFKTLAILLIIICAFGFYFYRINALKNHQKILEQKVLERTAELQEANTELEEKQEEILQQQEEILTQRDELGEKNKQLELKQEEILAQKDEIEVQKNNIEKAYNNIELISEFGQKITASLDPKKISHMIYNYINSIIDINAFGIGIYNEIKQIIEFHNFIENGIPKSYFRKEMSDNNSLSVRCLKNKEEIIINDLSNEYKSYLGNLNEMRSHEIPSSTIHIPLLIENNPIGTLTVSSNKKGAFEEKDIINIRALASYIAIALDNANAYKQIQSKNEAINGSIRYGLTIQKAMLIDETILNNYFESFILYRPKDVVSGDFYWFSIVPSKESSHMADIVTRHDVSVHPENISSLPMAIKYFLAVVDCTGHGVPGAFMSLIGSRLLNEIVNDKKIIEPAKILDHLNHDIAIALKQEESDNNDGMDVSLAMIEKSEKNDQFKITFAGAKLPLIYFKKKDSKIFTTPASRQSIGGTKLRHDKTTFTQVEIELLKGDTIWLFSDGLIDQCDMKRKRFGSKRLTELLSANVNLPLAEQKTIIEKALESHMHGEEQRDDITVLGLRL